MKIFFVRHGETQWNVEKKIQGKTDIPLNENGWNQARTLAEALQKRHDAGEFEIVRAYTSPQLRAAETARMAAEALEVPCIPVDGLREMDLGEWEGQNWDDIRATYGEVYTYWNEHRRYTHTPGGESYQEVVDRTLAALEKIIQQETGDVLVVTHSAVIMALRCYLEELPFEEMVRRFKARNTEIIEISSEEIENAIQRFHRGE